MTGLSCTADLILRNIWSRSGQSCICASCNVTSSELQHVISTATAQPCLHERYETVRCQHHCARPPLSCPAFCNLQVLREQKLQQQKQEHEDRIQRNLERASAPSFQKRKMKPAMTRSLLPKKVVSMKQAVNSADVELDQFLTRDFSQV